MKRRAVFVLPHLKAGGAERVAVLLLRHLPRESIDCHLALLSRTGRFLDDLPPDVRVHDLGGRRARYSLVSLWRLLRRLRPDVVLPNMGYLSLLLLSLKPFLPRRTRVVPQEHTLLSAQISEHRQPRLRRAAHRILYRRADRIICCAQALADDLTANFGLPPERLQVIYNPVDDDRVEAALSSGRSPFAGPGPQVVGVGRLVREKGFDRLIDAFAVVARQHPGARLRLIGEGRERPALLRRAEGHRIADRVDFAGYCPNPLLWMRHAHLVVQSSRREGLPMAILEAVACGTRVVAFDCPGGTREILDGIEGAALVADGDVGALASAILEVLGPTPPPRPRLPARFSREATVQAYAEALAGLPHRRTGCN